jgi:pimeloyl-ACP methyl ester carboxylesterase
MNNADVLEEMIGALWQSHGKGTKGVVLIGHSIGGAVTTAIAAHRPAWPLLGIAISGCLLNTPSGSKDTWSSLPNVPMIDLDSGLKDSVMFGPQWTYDDAMPQASHMADAPVPRNELIDIAIEWPREVSAVAAKVKVPVHHRQGEYDPLWVTNLQEVEAFRRIFSAAPEMDTKLFPHAGHCIEFHKTGRAFQLEQLAFALNCCVQAPPGSLSGL